MRLAKISSDQEGKTAALQRACELGEARSCLLVGVHFQNGTGCRADSGRAAALYGRACELGEIKGCNNVAVMLENGTGVARDVPRALTLFERNCQGGHALACKNVGRLYQSGVVGMDAAKSAEGYKRAYELASKGCADGDSEGCAVQGLLLRDGNGIPKDEARAAVLLKRSCDMGYKAICKLVSEAR